MVDIYMHENTIQSRQYLFTHRHKILGKRDILNFNIINKKNISMKTKVYYQFE